MKALAYMRCSGRGQIDGDTWDRQSEAISGYAAANGVEVVEWFREEGISGTKDLDDRPALQSLYVALEDLKINRIIIEKLDRLARDLLIQETIMGDLGKRGIEVISVCEPDLCSSDPSRVLVRQIFGAIAQYDRAMTVIKLRGARQRMKVSKGRCEGVLPFGSKPGEDTSLQYILGAKDIGWTPDHTAIAMNEIGHSTRSGKPWRGSTIRKILARQPV